MPDYWTEEVEPKPPEPDDPAYEKLQDQIERLDGLNDRLRTELARVRAERDRLASYVFEHGEEMSDQVACNETLAIMTRTALPDGDLAAALAEHDRRAAEGER